MRSCQEIPGQELFQYRDADGKRQSVSSGDVNAYLREIAGGDFTAKDFRTWAGTLRAAEALLAAGAIEGRAARRRAILAAIDDVAGELNNTRAVCRKYYVHPGVLDAFEAGRLAEALGSAGNGSAVRSAGLTGRERALAGFVRARSKRGAKR